MRRDWKIKEFKNELILAPTREFVCPFCGEIMYLHDFTAYYSTDLQGNYFYHCDVHLKCPRCSFWATFGVPISKEEYNKLVSSKFNGKILIYQYRNDEKLSKRIKEWGYW